MWVLGKFAWVSRVAGLSQGYDRQASQLVRPTLPVSTLYHGPGKGGQTTWIPSVAFRKSKEKLQPSLIGSVQPAAEKQPLLVL